MSLMFFDAFTRFGPKPKKHPAQPWTLEHLVQEMEHCSISGALVTSTACTLYDAMFENRRLSERLRGHDHLFPVWNVFPHWTGEVPEPQKLTELLEQHDVRAVTLFPKTNGWSLTSKTSRPLLAELERTRTLVLLDGLEEATPDQTEQLVEEYPHLPILLYRVWWNKQRTVLPLLLRHRNLHVGFDHLQISYGLEWMVEQGLAEQALYCSNATDMSMGAHRFYVDYAGVPASAKAKIASGNLVRLLKGQAPPRERVNKNEDALMAEARQGKPLSPLVIDFHAHVLDEGLNGAGGAYTMLRGGPKGVWDLAQRMGVDAIGFMSWNGLMVCDPDDGNRVTRAALDALPDTCWGLGTFDVIHDSPEVMRRKMEELFEDKRFLGLKPYPTFGKTYDDPAYEPWWQFGNQRKLYAGLHANNFNLNEFDKLCPKYPDMMFVAYHTGMSYQVADAAIERARKYSNFYAEITLTPVCLGIIDYLVQGMGADRVLYGSDLPMRDPRQQLGWVVYSRLPLADKKKVLGENARRLLERIRAANASGGGASVKASAGGTGGVPASTLR